MRPLIVWPDCAQTMRPIVGTVAVRYDSSADWRGEKAKPPISATNGMTSAREKMRTAKMLRMSCMPLRMR